ncbi:MAG: DUF4038 domain-containing protein, partial [Bacteroidota bacterium]
MRSNGFVLSFLWCLVASAQLQVSENGRYFERGDGKPFIWMGDTAWELFHRLDRPEADHYLTRRAEQKFTVIQAVILAENDGLRQPNAYGHVPFEDLDPTRPVEAYFQHVDYIVGQANELGLVVALLPTWGDKLYSLHPGAGPEVFTAENAAVFGEFLGERYKEADVVWVLGGDRNVDNFEVLEIWRAMASGLRKGDDGGHLITFHPRGASHSYYYLHNEDWLDFNMYQSGHARRYNPTYDFAKRDYLKHPVKPFVEGEPAYEDIPLAFWKYCDWDDPLRVPREVLDENLLIKKQTHFEEGYFTDRDVRVHAYWNMLSGAAGFTYGNNAVWQMFKKRGPVAIPCLYDWKESLERPGANQIRHLHQLVSETKLWEQRPDQSLVYGANPSGREHIRAVMTPAGDRAVVYLSVGQEV